MVAAWQVAQSVRIRFSAEIIEIEIAPCNFMRSTSRFQTRLYRFIERRDIKGVWYYCIIETDFFFFWRLIKRIYLEQGEFFFFFKYRTVEYFFLSRFAWTRKKKRTSKTREINLIVPLLSSFTTVTWYGSCTRAALYVSPLTHACIFGSLMRVKYTRVVSAYLEIRDETLRTSSPLWSRRRGKKVVIFPRKFVGKTRVDVK